MKKTSIVLLIVIAAVMASFIGVFSASTKAVNFDYLAQNPGEEFNVNGTLDKNFEVVYDAEQNVNLTVFHMRDEDNNLRKVHLKQPKPDGLERSIEINLKGVSYDNDQVYAEEILLKCPSKYNESNHLIETAEVPAK